MSQRFIIEMGMGTDQYGQDYTKAARRAIKDALGHSSIPMFDALGMDHMQMRVQVTVAVQEPDQVDCTALQALMPRGRAQVKAVFGGLNSRNPDTGNVIVVAQAAVEAFLDRQG
jgi:uncharacterized protein (TIGR02058 family)